MSDRTLKYLIDLSEKVVAEYAKKGQTFSQETIFDYLQLRYETERFMIESGLDDLSNKAFNGFFKQMTISSIVGEYSNEPKNTDIFPK